MALITEDREIRTTRQSAPRVSPSISAQETWTDYAGYLQTAHWRRTRNAAIVAASWKCSRCDQRSQLQVHHLTYERLGSERPDDLEVLCRSCHEGEHLAQDKRQHAGVYVKLVSLVLSRGGYETFADLLADVKDECRKAGVPYNGEAVWMATRDLHAKRRGILDAPEPAPLPAPDARDLRPFGQAEAMAILKRLNITVGAREMPRPVSMQAGAVDAFRRDCGLWNRPDLDGQR